MDRAEIERIKQSYPINGAASKGALPKGPTQKGVAIGSVDISSKGSPRESFGKNTQISSVPSQTVELKGSDHKLQLSQSNKALPNQGNAQIGENKEMSLKENSAVSSKAPESPRNRPASLHPASLHSEGSRGFSSPTAQPDPERERALAAAIATLEKDYGKGSIMRLDVGHTPERIASIPTGSIGLDIALGIGGLPRGRIVELYGPESSGKTTLALHLAAETQRLGGSVVYIDAEHALDLSYAGKLGVDTHKLLISQPDSGEQALSIAETLVRSNGVDLVVIDSVAALVPQAELDGDMGDSLPGLQARLMSQALRKLTASVSKTNTMVLFINQIRMKIGVMFGSPETTTGGNALKFYSSVRLDIRRIASIKESEEVIGNRTKVKIVKNKVAPPFREVEFDILYNEGISQTGELLDLGVQHGVIDKSGAWYAYKGERLGQGRDGARKFLKDHPELQTELRGLILDTVGVGSSAGAGLNPSLTTTSPVKGQRAPAASLEQ